MKQQTCKAKESTALEKAQKSFYHLIFPALGKSESRFRVHSLSFESVYPGDNSFSTRFARKENENLLGRSGTNLDFENDV